MGSNTAEGEKRNDFNVNQEDQNELSLAISKAVTQVLESSDWRSLSFPLDGASGKRSKAKNSVKRPMNAFMLYAQAARKKLSHLYPDLSYAKLSKTLGRIWKSLDESEKQPFVHEADRLRQKHKLDHPDYKFQPKRKEKRRSLSPNREPFEGGKIITGDVLKALTTSRTPPGHGIKHDSQELWPQNIHNGITNSHAMLLQPRELVNHTNTQLPSFTTTRINPPMMRRSPEIPKLSRNSPVPQHYQQPCTTYATSISQRPPTALPNTQFVQTRYFSPPPLQRSTTAGLFTPTSYHCVAKPPQTTATVFPQSNEFHNYTTNTQTFPYELAMHGNLYPKCLPPSSNNTQPPPLTSAPGEMSQSTNLLSGVNQILRDMFGNDKNNIV